MCYSKLKNNFWKKEVARVEQIPHISVLIWVDSSMIVLYSKVKTAETKTAEPQTLGEVLYPPLLDAVRYPCIP